MEANVNDDESFHSCRDEVDDCYNHEYRDKNSPKRGSVVKS